VLADPLEHLACADDRTRTTADPDVTLDGRVPQAQLDRVELQGFRELVEQ